MSVYEKLKKLQIELPAVSEPVASYVMYVQTGNTVYLSGHIAKKDGQPHVAQFGKDISVEAGQIAARNIAIEMIATLEAACAGNLDRVRQIVKLLSLVNSTGDFTDHHLVTNGASDLLVEIFGQKGRHARSSFGVAQIPTGACIEMELIAEID